MFEEYQMYMEICNIFLNRIDIHKKDPISTYILELSILLDPTLSEAKLPIFGKDLIEINSILGPYGLGIFSKDGITLLKVGSAPTPTHRTTGYPLSQIKEDLQCSIDLLQKRIEILY